MGEKTITGPVEPVHVAIVGTGEGGLPATGTIATTPGVHNPNLVINIVSPLIAILVRFGNTFCVSFAGSLTAGGITAKVMPHADFAQLLSLSAFLAACIAGVGLVKDCATVFSGLEKKFPLASGSV